MLAVKKSQEGFARSDDNPGSVINQDMVALKAYKAQKRQFKDLATLRDEVDSIKLILIDIQAKLSKFIP